MTLQQNQYDNLTRFTTHPGIARSRAKMIREEFIPHMEAEAALRKAEADWTAIRDPNTDDPRFAAIHRAVAEAETEYDAARQRFIEARNKCGQTRDWGANGSVVGKSDPWKEYRRAVSSLMSQQTVKGARDGVEHLVSVIDSIDFDDDADDDFDLQREEAKRQREEAKRQYSDAARQSQVAKSALDEAKGAFRAARRQTDAALSAAKARFSYRGSRLRDARAKNLASFYEIYGPPATWAADPNHCMHGL